MPPTAGAPSLGGGVPAAPSLGSFPCESLLPQMHLPWGSPPSFLPPPSCAHFQRLHKALTLSCNAPQ